MYETFYKLTTKPFRLSPDPQFFYPSTVHKRALSYLLYGLNQGEGFVVITGTPGTGKTTLAHKLLSQVDPQSVLVAHLTSTQIEAEDLLRLVATAFKLRSENVSKAGLLKDIESFLLARSRERKRCLLVVDEAQNLPPRSIEELRMLSNFQVGSKALLQIFLLGQDQFRTMLNSTNFEQLRQRIIADFHLRPLDEDETRGYIEARLRHTNWQNDPQFDAGAYSAIFEYTQGLPRRINMFCDRLLLYGFLENLHVLTRDSVNAVINELANDGAGRQDKVVYAPVEKGEARSATAGTVPFARLVQPEPVPAPVTVKTSQPVNLSPASQNQTERVRPLPHTPTPIAPAIPEHGNPAEKNAPPPATATDAAQSRVFAPRIERETRGESAAPPLRIDQSPPSTQPVPALASQKQAPHSLAASESRWLWFLVSAIAVILLLALWFYPSLRELIEPKNDVGIAPPSSPNEQQNSTSSEPATFESIAPSTSEHHVEDIPAPAPESALNGGHGGTESATVTAGMTPQATTPLARVEKPLAPTTPLEVDAPAATTTAVAPDALSQTPSPEPPAAAPEPPTPAPIPAPEAAEPPPTKTKPAGKRAAAAQEKTPVASKENNAPAANVTAGISERELALLLRKFSRAYERGELTAFVALFAPDVRTEDHNTIDAVRNDYAELFRKTVARDITIGSIRWDISGDVAHGTGPFEVRVRSTANEPYRVRAGNLRVSVQKKGRSVLITALYHKS